MRIGVVSDTHNHLANVARIVELLNRAGVDHVVHTGDITQPKTLDVLARLVAPLTGVLGNNDLGEREGLVAAARHHGMTLVDPPLSLELGERRLLVAHDPRVLAGRDDFELALHGHTHRHSVVREAGRLVLNPGEGAGHLPGRNSVGIVDLGGLEVEILRF